MCGYEAGGGEAVGEVVADAGVHCFALDFEDAGIFGDEVVEFAGWVCEGADFVGGSYEVAV